MTSRSRLLLFPPGRGRPRPESRFVLLEDVEEDPEFFLPIIAIMTMQEWKESEREKPFPDIFRVVKFLSFAMFPTAIRLSKASRRPLTTKRGNKDYYKGMSYL